MVLKGFTMSFLKVKSYKDLSVTSKKFAASRGFELLVGKVYEQNKFGFDIIVGYDLELWYNDDNSELFLIAYSIQEDRSLYFKQKTLDIFPELSKVEDLPLVIKTDKELRSVISYISKCLKA